MVSEFVIAAISDTFNSPSKRAAIIFILVESPKTLKFSAISNSRSSAGILFLFCLLFPN